MLRLYSNVDMSSDSDLPPCPIHLRGLEFFCRTDNVCVCSTCVGTPDHLGHNITPAKREWHLKKVCACGGWLTANWASLTGLVKVLFEKIKPSCCGDLLQLCCRVGNSYSYCDVDMYFFNFQNVEGFFPHRLLICYHGMILIFTTE